MIPKKAVEDTMLVTTNLKTGEKIVVPVPKGTNIDIRTTGLHYNRKMLVHT